MRTIKLRPRFFMPSRAQQIATALAERFLEAGNYGTPDPGQMSGASAASAVPAVEAFFDCGAGFSGLAVQSVGFTSGAQEESVIIYVTRGSKRALKDLPSAAGDVPVVTKVIGKMKAGPVQALSLGGGGNFYERNGRVACGSSTAPSGETYAGTFGALLARGGNIMALSNNHVFAACNHTPVGLPILSPASGDARPGRRAPTAIALFDNMTELRSGVSSLVPPMSMDVATASVGNPILVSSWQGDSTDGYDTPPAVVTPASGMKVKKFGRTTGHTRGVVEAFVPTPWVLPYKSRAFTAHVWFENTWTVRSADSDPFGLPGDSGSLVVTDDGAGAVGLLFAVSNAGNYGIMCELGGILATFPGSTLLSGHGI